MERPKYRSGVLSAYNPEQGGIINCFTISVRPYPGFGYLVEDYNQKGGKYEYRVAPGTPGRINNYTPACLFLSSKHRLA